MKPIVGKAYQLKRGWYVALKSEGQAVIIKRGTRGGKTVYLTAAYSWDADGPDEHPTLEDAIRDCAWVSWPNNEQNPSTNLQWSASCLRDASDDRTLFNCGPLIEAVGHYSAFLMVDFNLRGQSAEYWAAAAKTTPDMEELEGIRLEEAEQESPNHFHEWALRLGALHARPLSSMELVALLASEDPEMRAWALTATTGEVPAPTARTRSRRKV